MTNQLDLTGQPALAPPEVTLRPRQRLALDYIAAHAPVPSDELGALLHEDRRARGLSGHSSDARCDWCGTEGRTVGAALRKLGLVRERRGLGWVLAGKNPGPARPTSQGQEIPY